MYVAMVMTGIGQAAQRKEKSNKTIWEKIQAHMGVYFLQDYIVQI
jgi:hypothetical protein